MDLISKLEKRFHSWAIPRLSLYLIGLQVLGWVMEMRGLVGPRDLVLQGNAVLEHGEWWRLLSFMMLPPDRSILWVIISLLVFRFVGDSLEQRWGTFKFNLFILNGYLMTVLASFFFPGELMTNLYFLGSVFIAFATLFPNIEFRIYFILPVKAKWLGWFTAVAYLAMLVLGGNHLGNRLCIFVALFNYALFFGGDFVRGLKSGKRKKEFIAEPKMASSSALHVCSVCGITDQDDGMMSFRYCSTCGECFCEAHMDTHQHS